MPMNALNRVRRLDSDRVPPTLVLILTVCLMIYYSGPICPDVSGQFWLARAMRNGSRLYVDIVEINPPLWFWMAMPVDWIAQVLGVRSVPVTILIVGLLVLAVVKGAARLLRLGGTTPSPLYLGYLALILLIMPMNQLEQREHLALLGAVPYLMLAAVRRQQRAADPWLAVLIGAGAALGFALKPYFLAVPLLTEFWLLTALRRQWRPFRVETMALALTGGAYGFSVLIFTPQYFSIVVPQQIPVYQLSGPAVGESLGALPWLWGFMIAGIAAHWRPIVRNRAPATIAFLCGAAGFGLAYFVQHKGWLYQGLPATGCLALALGAVQAETGRARGLVRLFVPALMALPLSLPLVKTELTIGPANDIAPAVADLKRGDGLGLISPLGAADWPATTGRDLRLSSRFGQYWMLAAFDKHPHDARVRQFAYQAIRDTALDYRCLPPKVIVFTRFHARSRNVPTVDDPYPFFMADPAFAAVMSHYRLWKKYGIFEAYHQVTPIAPVDPSNCRNPG